MGVCNLHWSIGLTSHLRTSPKFPIANPSSDAGGHYESRVLRNGKQAGIVAIERIRLALRLVVVGIFLFGYLWEGKIEGEGCRDWLRLGSVKREDRGREDGQVRFVESGLKDLN